MDDAAQSPTLQSTLGYPSTSRPTGSPQSWEISEDDPFGSCELMLSRLLRVSRDAVQTYSRALRFVDKQGIDPDWWVLTADKLVLLEQRLRKRREGDPSIDRRIQRVKRPETRVMLQEIVATRVLFDSIDLVIPAVEQIQPALNELSDIVPGGFLLELVRAVREIRNSVLAGQLNDPIRAGIAMIPLPTKEVLRGIHDACRGTENRCNDLRWFRDKWRAKRLDQTRDPASCAAPDLDPTNTVPDPNWPNSGDLVSAAGISQDTFRRVRDEAGIKVSEKGGAAAARRYSPEEVRAMREAAQRGACRNGRRLAEAWERWSQRP